jgi:hypothetical protein
VTCFFFALEEPVADIETSQKHVQGAQGMSVR